ncbi:MFS transporter [Alicyclobacillus acidoterrestris]|uniref:MFS transporter n=1 Tax=Alicyclobacillus suci TaxID=2816080 RepID=UPI00118EC332|nr:MFS transporter [Alicyclobacillus suci]GEO26510.1 MFS transporter [Alicyclobacillus acidoterrestris]
MSTVASVEDKHVPFQDGKTVRKAILAGSIGNVMEWYDWSIYGFFASTISKHFFPAGNSVAALLSTFLVFALGFIMRPLGSLVFGPYGDKVGRRKALAMSVILMAIGTFMIGVIPTYEQIGNAAPILLVVARLIQGFSAGAEWGGSTSFLVEYAPRWKRGFYGSWQQFSTGAGLFFGSVVSTVIIASLSPTALDAWGWRVAFLIGIILGIVGLYLRMKMEDTPKFREVANTEHVAQRPLKEMVTKYPLQVLQAIGFTISWTVSYYITFTYLPTYIKTVVNMSFGAAMASNLIILAFFIILIPIVGALSDRVGRKKLLMLSCAGFAILAYPMFLLINRGSFVMILIPQFVLALFEAFFAAPGPAALAEIFPTRVRNSSLSIGYNIGVALFGGTAPMIATYLISSTHSKLSPTYYVIGCAVVTFFVLMGLKDRYREELD